MKIVLIAFAASVPCVCTAAAEPSSSAASAPPQVTRTFDVRQSVVVRDIPRGTRTVRLWVSIPGDGPEQRVLDLTVLSAPGPWRVVREKDHGNRFLLVEATAPETSALTTVVGFTVRRQSTFRELDPRAAPALTEAQQRFFAGELRRDAPHMEVTPAIRKIADDVCAGEKNPVRQTHALLDYVAANADHYSKDPSKPKWGIGDATICLDQGGGCCTDLHSLFIALARARGIPARLQMGYRLQPKNEGLEADPGYRCWPEYFIAGAGWVPADIVEADAAEGAQRVPWLSGLNERRIQLNEGRDFDLPGKQHAAPVNTMSIGYAEFDGVPARVLPEGDKGPQVARTVFYKERTNGGTKPLKQ